MSKYCKEIISKRFNNYFVNITDELGIFNWVTNYP